MSPDSPDQPSTPGPELSPYSQQGYGPQQGYTTEQGYSPLQGYTTPNDPQSGAVPASPEPHRPAAAVLTTEADPRASVRGGKVSALWIGVITAAILLILLLIFIAQNSRTVVIHFLGFHGHISLAVAILLAAMIGILLVAVPGTARIIQLRRALKRTPATHRPRP
jgi:uncharacterized integral membrane protein